MKRPPVRVHNQQLSVWQSLVKATAEKLYDDNPAFAEKMIAANDVFVAKASATEGFPVSGSPLFATDYPSSTTSFAQLSSDNLTALLEEQFIQWHIRTTGGIQLDATVYRPYSDDPWQVWVDATSAAYTLEAYEHQNTRKYNNYTPGNISTFGVIDWEIPQGSTVGIIGDWGTGMEDAIYLLKDLMSKPTRISALIHLGDVYYAGTDDETTQNFVNVLNTVFSEVGYSVPVFTIPGNHEYYSLGYPYFAMLPGLNSQHDGCVQEASYFCLRVEGAGWQFLAMDTGYNDSDPLNAINPCENGPYLRSAEQKWHKDKLDTFSGTTILLSHHQLFSANARINGRYSTDGLLHSDYKNEGLYNTFQKYFKNDIAAWIWGHEHNLAIYQNGLEGLAKGRLLGCSAYEEETSIDPYSIQCHDYSYYTDSNHPNGVRVSSANNYFNHAYAILTIPNNLTANGSITADYYEYPSWGGTTPKPAHPASTLLFTESFTRPTALQQPTVTFNSYVQLTTQRSGKPNFLNGADAHLLALLENYPGTLQILPAQSGYSSNVCDSNKVYLVSTSPLMNQMYLTANGTTGELYYASTYSSAAVWQLRIDGGDENTPIQMSDSIHIVSDAYSGYGINCNSSNILTLTNHSSSRLSFVVSSGISIPAENPLLTGQPYNLAAAYQNQWYYLNQAKGFGSSTIGGQVISLHDIVAADGHGACTIGLYNYTNGGMSDFSYLGQSYSTPRVLNSGDTINFNTNKGTMPGLVTGFNFSGMGPDNPLLLTPGDFGEFTAIKVNPIGHSHLGDVILQNDLIYLASQSFPGKYMCVVEHNGTLFLGLSTTPTYCRLDTQEFS